MATNLMTHAIEEMGILADLLPDLYAQETADNQKDGGSTDDR